MPVLSIWSFRILVSFLILALSCLSVMSTFILTTQRWVFNLISKVLIDVDFVYGFSFIVFFSEIAVLRQQLQTSSGCWYLETQESILILNVWSMDWDNTAGVWTAPNRSKVSNYQHAHFLETILSGCSLIQGGVENKAFVTLEIFDDSHPLFKSKNFVETC